MSDTKIIVFPHCALLVPEFNYIFSCLFTNVGDVRNAMFSKNTFFLSVSNPNNEKQESFSDLLTSVLSPDEGTVGFEASACVDLSALDGLNLDFPPMNPNNSGNYNSVSEVVAAAIMATSEDSEAQNFSSGTTFHVLGNTIKYLLSLNLTVCEL